MEIKPTCTDGRIMSHDADSTKSVFFFHFQLFNKLRTFLLSVPRVILPCTNSLIRLQSDGRLYLYKIFELLHMLMAKAQCCMRQFSDFIFCTQEEVYCSIILSY